MENLSLESALISESDKDVKLKGVAIATDEGGDDNDTVNIEG